MTGPTKTSTDGWRARGSSAQRAPQRVVTHKVQTPRPATSSWNTNGWVQQTGYEDDIAGPSLRVASRPRPARGYRVAQQDDLERLLEKPFGVNTDSPDPNSGPEFAEPTEQETAEADRMFDDLPADPFDEPETIEPAEDAETMFDSGDAATPDDTLPFGDSSETEMADSQPVESLFSDDEIEQVEPGEPVPSYDEDVYDGNSFYDRELQTDLSDDLAAPLTRGPDSRFEALRAEASQDCEEDLAELKARTLDTIDLRIGVDGMEGEDFPFNCSIDDGTLFAPRNWCEITYMWKASGLCHKPLYFEDIHLERYGHSWGPYLDPVMSGVHFFGRLPVLPYCMGLKTPNECVYTLGHYRPGSCAPYFIDPIPFTWRAALFQAGATVGVAGFLP